MVRPFFKGVGSSREERLLSRIDELQSKLDELHNDKQRTSSPSEESVLVAEIRKMQGSILELKRKASFQNRTIDRLQVSTSVASWKIQTSQKKLEEHLNKASQLHTDLDSELFEEPVDSLLQGSMDVIAPSTKLQWTASGYSSVIPHPDFNYFPRLAFGPRLANDGLNYDYSEGKVISAIIPCYNEGGRELDITIRSLHRQRLPRGWRVEVVIVMDGADHMDPTMVDKLHSIFGIKVHSNDPKNDPFAAFPDAQTIVVEPTDENAAHRRPPAVDGSVGGYTLVVKRHNHRKANSQMWWLGPHGAFLKTRYSLATDCGTVFARTATAHLLRRLEAEPSMHAVTGFQRIMTSEMQGDGRFEFLHHPFHFLLRMLQRFEFEVDNASFKFIYDSIGCMHVIPGPCGLFRYSAMGSLREGLMHQYFRLFQHSSQGLIVGNVELVEDRIPGTLLSFPLKSDKEKKSEMPPEGWPRTGFEPKALFFIEAEKPLSQLVKQRRRWLNGTFATYIWMLNEGIISRSNQDPVNKVLSWLLVVLSLVQGIVIRLFGPALLVIWMFRFGLFLPDIISDPRSVFEPTITLVEMEFDAKRLHWGLLTGGSYLLLYIVYILGHIPHAKPVARGIQITRFTEPIAYTTDSRSAFRPWLTYPVLWANFLVVILFCLNVIGIVSTRGWYGTPNVVKILISVCFAPFGIGFVQGLLTCDFRCLLGMLYSAPFALPLQVWFTVWLPAYATTRLSDLTWGNREGTNNLDESEKALARARNGRKVGWMLIWSTTAISIGVIVLMQFSDLVFPIYVLLYTMILSSNYVLSLLDMFLRFITCSTCDGNEDPLSLDIEDDSVACGLGCADESIDDEDMYVNMGAMEHGKGEVSDKASTTDESDSSASYAKMEEDESPTAPGKPISPSNETITSKERNTSSPTEKSLVDKMSHPRTAETNIEPDGASPVGATPKDQTQPPETIQQQLPPISPRRGRRPKEEGGAIRPTTASFSMRKTRTTQF